MPVTIGLGVFVVLTAVTYGMARLAPVRSEAELDRIGAERGERVQERFRQMEAQRRYTVAIGRVVLPVALIALVVALVVESR